MIEQKQIFWQKNIRALIVFLFIALFLWLIDQNFALSGKFAADYSFNKLSPFISQLMPPSRLTDVKSQNGSYYQEITGEPVYFDVKTPYNHFKNAKLTIRYENSNQNLIQAGVVADEKTWYVLTKPIENKALDSLISSGSWNVIRKENLVLLQREKKFQSVDDFLSNLPATNEIATFHYDKLNNNFKIKDYRPSDKEWEIDKTLKGSQEINTYIKDENLNFVFTFQDINKDQKDDVTVALYSQSGKIKDFTIQDDFTDYKKEATLTASGLSEGVYKIKITVSDNILINKIRTSQKYLTFVNKINLADINQSATLYTNGSRITAQTLLADGLQTIKVGNQEITLDEVHRQYSQNFDNDVKEIMIEKNNIELSADGFFSFTKASFFNPVVTNFSPAIDLDKKGINYIIADYQSPTKQGDDSIATAEFDITWIKPTNRKYKFLLSMPDLSQNENIIKIKEIKVEFSK